MRRFRLITATCLLLAAGATLSACGGTGSSTDGGASANGLSGIVRDTPLQVGSVSLPDVTVGQPDGPFTFQAQPGQLLIVYFGYTNCPDVCPTTLAAVKAATAQLGADADRIDLAMVTVDPDRDTPEVLSGYLSSFATRYHAIRTTDPAQLTTAEQAFNASSAVTTAPDGTVDVQHTAITYVVDDQGTVLVEWPFGTSTDDMASDLKVLLARQQPS